MRLPLLICTKGLANTRMPLRRIAYKQICLEGSVRKTYIVFTCEISFGDETHPG